MDQHSLWTRVADVVFGKPLTHEQAEAQRLAQLSASTRGDAEACVVRHQLPMNP